VQRLKDVGHACLLGGRRWRRAAILEIFLLAIHVVTRGARIGDGAASLEHGVEVLGLRRLVRHLPRFREASRELPVILPIERNRTAVLAETTGIMIRLAVSWRASAAFSTACHPPYTLLY
jgi:hypothetical protein